MILAFPGEHGNSAGPMAALMAKASQDAPTEHSSGCNTESPAERIAVFLHARRTGQGRWVAKCPAHADRAPSLSIAQGSGGRALLHCHAGCSMAAVLQSAGLRMAQLFAAGPSPTPQQRAALARQQAHQRAQQAASRRAERLRTALLRSQADDLHASVARLARLLATLGDDVPGADALTVCLHDLLAELRLVEGELTGETTWL